MVGVLYGHVYAPKAKANEARPEEVRGAEEVRARAGEEVQVREAWEDEEGGAERGEEAEGAGEGGDGGEAEGRVVRLDGGRDRAEVEVGEERVRVEEGKEGVVEEERHPEGEAAERGEADAEDQLEHEDVVAGETGFEEVEREMLQFVEEAQERRDVFQPDVGVVVFYGRDVNAIDERRSMWGGGNRVEEEREREARP